MVYEETGSQLPGGDNKTGNANVTWTSAASNGFNLGLLHSNDPNYLWPGTDRAYADTPLDVTQLKEIEAGAEFTWTLHLWDPLTQLSTGETRTFKSRLPARVAHNSPPGQQLNFTFGDFDPDGLDKPQSAQAALSAATMRILYENGRGTPLRADNTGIFGQTASTDTTGPLAGVPERLQMTTMPPGTLASTFDHEIKFSVVTEGRGLSSYGGVTLPACSSTAVPGFFRPGDYREIGVRSVRTDGVRLFHVKTLSRASARRCNGCTLPRRHNGIL